MHKTVDSQYHAWYTILVKIKETEKMKTYFVKNVTKIQEGYDESEYCYEATSYEDAIRIVTVELKTDLAFLDDYDGTDAYAIEVRIS